MTPLRIGTRGSRLALWQAHHVKDLLLPLAAPRPVEVVVIHTAGDKARDVPLTQIGGEGAFTKEIQRALLDERVDLAVHSLKDLPTIPVEGLELAAVPKRGPFGDVFVSQRYRRFDDLPRGAVVASSSLRRRAQAWFRRPDLTLVEIRGNIETRLRKLSEEGWDGLILARAGLERLGLSGVISEPLDFFWMLPAVGQGALGLECRSDDLATREIAERLNHTQTFQAVRGERALLSALGGGCQVPLGALGIVLGNLLMMRAAVIAPDGSRRFVEELYGPAEEAEAVGQGLAQQLLAAGAHMFLP